MILLECKHLTKSFDRKTVLDDVSLKIEPGKIYGLLGKNGAGKTTLIKLINDLLTPTDGKILFKNKAIGVNSVNSKAHISYLPERTYLDKDQRVDVRHGGTDKPVAARQHRVDAALAVCVERHEHAVAHEGRASVQAEAASCLALDPLFLRRDVVEAAERLDDDSFHLLPDDSLIPRVRRRRGNRFWYAPPPR